MNSAEKQDLQYIERPPLSLCRNVGITQGTRLNLSDENLQGTPGPVTGPQECRTRSAHFDFWQASPPHFFSFTRPQTLHGQCYRSCGVRTYM